MKKLILPILAVLAICSSNYNESLFADNSSAADSAARVELKLGGSFDHSAYKLVGVAVVSDEGIFDEMPYGQVIVACDNIESSGGAYTVALDSAPLAVAGGKNVKVIAQLRDANDAPLEATTQIELPKAVAKGKDCSVDATLGAVVAPESDVWFMPTWDQEYYQYESPEGVKRVDIKKEYGVSTSGKDSSVVLQTAINDVSAAGGGEVYVPFGTYLVKQITMRSNVTLLVEAGATFKPLYPVQDLPHTPSVSMFSFAGDENGPIDNAQIIGLNGRFNVELDPRKTTQGAKVFLFSSVNNFRVSNVNIYDVKTTYPIFTFNPTKKGYKDNEGNDLKGPRDGVISHARAENCHYGYGLVQIQSASDVLFEKISGVGGTTLRAETGAQGMNNVQWGGVSNLVGRYVYCKNGNAAAMISPHSMHNGDLDFRHIISDGCGIGVRAEGGYISDKRNEGLVTAPGTFQNIIVSDVIGRFGWGAQIKIKHFHYMPTQLQEYCPPIVHKISEPAAAIAVVVDGLEEGKDAKSVVIENVTAVGFLTPAVVTESWRDWAIQNPEYDARWSEWIATQEKNR